MPARTLVISRIFSLICFLILICLAAYPVLAQDSTKSGTTRREAVKEKIETRKEKVETKIASVREKAATREAALKAKLDAFKNRTKAQIADRVNTNLNKINQNQTASMQRHLNNMTSILSKLEARVNSGSPDIKDVASANLAISSAKQTIATTSAAVTVQSEKDYTIEVTSESRVKADATSKRRELHQDLLALRKLVIDAKQAVVYAIKVAKGEGVTSGQ